MYIKTNHDLFNERPRPKDNITIIYDNQPGHDSILGAWLIQERFREHPSVNTLTLSQFERGTRTHTGHVFLVGLLPKVQHTKRLLHYAKQIFIINNDLSLKLSIDALELYDDESKLRICFEENVALTTLIRRFLTCPTETPVVDLVIKDPSYVSHLNDAFFHFDRPFHTLTTLNNELKAGQANLTQTLLTHQDRLDDTWRALRKTGLESTTLTLGSHSIPVVAIPQGALRRGIAEKFAKAIKADVAGVIYQRQNDVAVYLLSTPTSTMDVGEIARQFGGDGNKNHADFIIDKTTVDELY